MKMHINSLGVFFLEIMKRVCRINVYCVPFGLKKILALKFNNEYIIQPQILSRYQHRKLFFGKGVLPPSPPQNYKKRVSKER